MRDKKEVLTYYGACEGLQETMYFRRIQNLINSNPNATKRVNFIFDQADGGSPTAVCNKAYNSPNFNDPLKLTQKGKIISIFDYDFKHEEFVSAINYCNKRRLIMAYSNVNFNLWLILHKEQHAMCVTSNEGYTKILRKIYNLPKDADIKEEQNIKIIVNSIDIEDIKRAIEIGRIINNNQKKYGLLLDGLDDHYSQPFVMICEFVYRVFREVGLI